MKQRVTPSALRRVKKDLEKQVGGLPKDGYRGREEFCFAIENNVVLAHRQDPKMNTQRYLEAIDLVMLYADEYLNDHQWDLELEDEDPKTVEFFNMILETIDPYAQEQVPAGLPKTLAEVKNIPGLNDMMTEFYKNLVIIMLLITHSIGIWSDLYGREGYFKYLESVLGSKIKGPLKFEYEFVDEEEKSN